MTPNALLTPGPAVGLGERPESADLVRCRAFRRRSLHKTHNGRSALVAGTALYAPKRPTVFAVRIDGIGCEAVIHFAPWVGRDVPGTRAERVKPMGFSRSVPHQLSINRRHPRQSAEFASRRKAGAIEGPQCSIRFLRAPSNPV